MNKPTLAIACTLLTLSLTTNADQDSIDHSGNDFKLSLDTQYSHTDNYLLSPSDEKSNQFWLISPAMQLQVQSKHQAFSMAANARHRKYNNYSSDDHTDVNLTPSYQYKWSVNQGIYLNLNWQTLFEQRGTGLSIGSAQALEKLDEKESTSGVVGYQYGSDESIARLSFELAYKEQQYNTRREQSKLLDQKSTLGRVSFDYLYGTSTYLATDISYEQVRFQYQPFYDKDKSTGLLGVKWSLSSFNRFEALLGYQQVTFKESIFEDDSSVKWRVNWHWQPKSSLSLSFGSSRDFEEANRLINSYRLVDTHQLSVSKQINDRFTIESKVAATQQTVFFEHEQTSEDYLTADVNLGYNISERTQVYIAYQYRDLSASQEYLEHQRNNVAFGIKVDL